MPTTLLITITDKFLDPTIIRCKTLLASQINGSSFLIFFLKFHLSIKLTYSIKCVLHAFDAFSENFAFVLYICFY